jgi:hypothetical protein
MKSPSAELKVDLDAEVLKLAQADGVTSIDSLQEEVLVKRYDNYAATIKSYYRGYDVGFSHGLNEAATPIVFWVRTRNFLWRTIHNPLVAAVIGATIATAAFSIVRSLR